MMMRKLVSLLVLFGFLTLPLLAQEVRVFLKNGRYIDGTISEKGDDFIVLKTAYGRIEIKEDQIRRIEDLKAPKIVEEPQPIAIAPPSPEEPPEVKTETPTDVKPAETNQEKEGLDKLFEKLKKAETKDKYEIAQEIVKLGKEVTPYLLKEMDKADDEIIDWITTIIGQLKDERAISPLIEKLRDKNPKIRAVSISTLANITGPDVAKKIVPFLKDEDMVVRRASISALGKFGYVDGIFDLVGLLADGDLTCRKLASTVIVELARKLGDTSKLVKEIADLVDSAKEETRADIINVLGRLKNKDAESVLVKFISDESRDIRANAIIALGELGSKDAASAILDRIPVETDRWVKIQIAGALPKIGGEEVIPSLIEMLKDENDDVRVAASRALLPLTNRSFGTDYDKWMEWYKKAKGIQ